jgi:hypothetical protein
LVRGQWRSAVVSQCAQDPRCVLRRLDHSCGNCFHRIWVSFRKQTTADWPLLFGLLRGPYELCDEPRV